MARWIRGASDRRGRRLAAALIRAALVGCLWGGPASAQTEPGPIGAWGFDEGSGTTAADASGNNRTATISGATWTTHTTGGFGLALLFDGVNDRVTAGTVTLGPPLTLMAWVFNPSNATAETIVTVGDARDLSLQSGVIAFYDGSTTRTFGAALSTNTWHHVALVYDGATLRAYLNAAPRGTAQSVSLPAVTGALQIGAGRGFFGGRIDEVRVYTRALTQAEVQQTMNTRAGTPPPADTPPARSSGQPTGTLPAGTTQTTLALSTNETATCRYSPSVGVPYDSMTLTFATTGGTTHSTPVAGLADGRSYTFYVRCQDVALNANPDDFSIAFSVASASAGGLLAAYGFDEGSGTTTADASGNNRTATISGATWTTHTTGGFGLALLFDGVNDRITTAGTVTLGPPFTLMAWVFDPSNATTETILTLGTTRDFSLRRGVLAFYDGGTTRTFGAALSTNTWHHVALVYDGATLRAYLNAAPRGPARSVSLPAVTGALQIGAGRGFFSGRIDEVRVYNNALTQAEVQTLMNTRVAGAPPTVLALTAPADGATVLGTTITATYTVSGDRSQYDHVHLYLDSDPVRMDLDGDGVYQFTNVPVGAHTLRGVPARADHSEFGTASTVSFATAVDPADPIAPTVALDSPAAGATLSGVFTLQAEASDNVTVAGVEFFVDGVAVGSADTAAPWTAPWNTASAPDGPHTLTVRARDTAGNETISAPVDVAVANDPSNPVVVGQWGAVLPWPTAPPPVHMLLQPDGQVLMFDEETGGTGARLWNPATGAFTSVPTTSNLFCAGHTALADGRSIVIGGHVDPGPFRGIRDTNLFDPTAQTWSRVGDMNFARWYPTATTLPDGRVLAISGWIRPGQLADTPEVYDPNANRWTALTAATRSNPMYSFMFVLPDGTVLNAGPDRQTRRLDVARQTWTDVGPSFITGHSAVMYEPGRVMKSGTFADVDNPGPSVDGRTVVIDMNGANPAWREVAAMAFPRSYHNLVLLPNGTVLAVGGGRTQDGFDVNRAVHEAESWDPATQAWRTMARMQRPRLHHSTALLLADGRVLTAGGNLGTIYDEANAEIYSPPYLFRGPRPTIASIPPSVDYGAPFFVETPDAPAIARVSLIRSGAVTHGFDQNQRYLPLTFTPTANGLQIQAPPDANAAPPGDYMLFILNANGVPAVARFLRLAPPAP